MSTRSRWWAAGVAALAAGVFAAGVAAGFFAPPLWFGQAPTLTANGKAWSAMEALYEGHVDMSVVGEFACATLRDDGEEAAVLWPYGFRAADDGSAILDAFGREVVRDGEWVGLGGGWVQDDTGPCGGTEVFVVGEILP